MKGADIVVACLGKPKFIQGSWLKDNAVVIDCGITPMQGIEDMAAELRLTFMSAFR